MAVAAACASGPERRIVAPSGKPAGSDRVPAGVCINEVDTEKDYIELYNPTDEPCDLSGLRIRKNSDGWLTDATKSRPFAVEEGVTLPAKGYAVLGCKGSTDRYEGVPLGTSATGLSGSKSLLLELVDRQGNRLDWFVNSSYDSPRAADAWDACAEHVFAVAGRHPDGSGTWCILDEATPGRSNSEARIEARFKHTQVDFQATEPNEPALPEISYAEALDYVFDMEVMPEILIEITPEEWNRLLAAYDRNSNTEEYVRCTASFTKEGATHRIADAGLRLRGNTSRRRPEGTNGQMHDALHPDWHHCHFMLHLRKFVKDDAHTIGGVRKLHLKWFKDDPAYVREIYCYDLFRRFGIPTAPRCSYCRLRLHVIGDRQEAYYGVYCMLEAVDDEFVEARETLFGNVRGNLWKCSFGADLGSTDDWKFGADDDSGSVYAYELKTGKKEFAAAREQLCDFIRNLNARSGADFRSWIASVTDVELLLRSYAVNVAVGMWDDYWNNSNNYYLYFASCDTSPYRVYWIPFDYDNTLGTSQQTGAQSDAGRQDPLRWGPESNPLIRKLLEYDDYRTLYLDALRELTADDDLFRAEGSMARIRAWQRRIAPFVNNDTGEDTSVADRPAPWGNHPEYRLTEDGPNNFFRIKAASIPK